MEEDRLKEPECYANTESGDLYIIWHAKNRPVGFHWVRISREAYEIWTGNIFYTTKKGDS